jgi:hypothetical protein
MKKLFTIFVGDGCSSMGNGILPRTPERKKVFTDHNPLESLGTLHTKTMSRLQLAMMDFDFEIRYKKGSEILADYLSRSFTKIGAISALDMNWAHEQEKDNLSNLIKKSLNKKWIYKFPMPDWFKYAEFITNMDIVKTTSSGSRKIISYYCTCHLS